MLAELFKDILTRLDTRYQPEMKTIVDPETGAQVVGSVLANGSWNTWFTGRPTMGFKFPRVSVFSAASLVAYAKHHADDAIESGEALLRVNKSGLFLTIDYGAEQEPDERQHAVSFPAAFDEECEVAAAAITGALGKWIDLDQFDALLDKCAPFISNFTALYEAAANLEGKETVKIARTSTSHQISIQGDVAGSANLPKEIQVALMFMANPIKASIPIRLKVESKQIQFHLVDNGAIAKARMEALKLIKAQVVQELPGLLVIDGTIQA